MTQCAECQSTDNVQTSSFDLDIKPVTLCENCSVKLFFGIKHRDEFDDCLDCQEPPQNPHLPGCAYAEPGYTKKTERLINRANIDRRRAEVFIRTAIDAGDIGFAKAVAEGAGGTFVEGRLEQVEGTWTDEKFYRIVKDEDQA